MLLSVICRSIVESALMAVGKVTEEKRTIASLTHYLNRTVSCRAAVLS